MSRLGDQWGNPARGDFNRLGGLQDRSPRSSSYRPRTSSIPFDQKGSQNSSALAAILVEFIDRWERGESPQAEEYLDRLSGADSNAAVELIYQEFCRAELAGMKPNPAEYLDRFPAQKEALNRLLELHHGFTSSQLKRCLDAETLFPIPEVGDEVGPYRLCRELGRGGFAQVFLAKQADLDDRPVVVKLSARITPEPQLLARARHTYIVEVFSHDTIDGGALQVICMPFLGGAPLDDVLDEGRRRAKRPQSGRDLLTDLDRVSAPEFPSTGPDRPARTVIAGGSYRKAIAWIIARLAEALDFAYEQGVAHGDIKPSNILLTADGVPMLLDFNLAVSWRFTKINEEPRYVAGGTLAYMAPERLQAVFDPSQLAAPSAQDRHRADIYALGVVLLESLTGLTPDIAHKKGQSAQQLAARYAESRSQERVVAEWSSQPGIDAALRSILARCLAPKPADRYERASQLSEDLDRWRTDRPLRTAEEPSVAYRVLRLGRRRKVELAAAVVVTCILGVIVAWGLRHAAAQERALVHLANYWDRADSGVFWFRRYEQGRPVGQGDPAQIALRHLVHFEADSSPDWRRRADVRDLPEPNRSELMAWILEQVLRHSRAVELRPDARDEWRQALTLVEREYRIAPLSPLNTERRRLQRRLGLKEGLTPSPSQRTADRSQRWVEEYLLGVEVELDGSRATDELVHFENSLASHPDFFWGHYRAAAVAYRLGKSMVEAMHLERCIALRPRNALIRVQIAGCLFSLGRDAEALAECNKAISLDSSQPESYFSRSHIWKRMGKQEERAADLRRFEVLARQHGKDLRGRLRLDLLLATEKAGGTISTDDLARKILEIDPEHIDARVLLADSLMRKNNPQDIQEAVAHLSRVLVLNPDHLWALYTHGILLCIQRAKGYEKDFFTLVNHPRFDEFVREYPDALNAFHLLVHFYLTDKNVPLAIETAERGLRYSEKLRTMRGESHYILARAYAAASEKDPAFRPKVEAELRSAICLNATYVLLYLPKNAEMKPFREEFLRLAQAKIAK